MPILESIRNAEAKAELMRNEATEKVRILLEKTRVDSEEKVKLLFEKTRQEEMQIDQNTLKEIALKEQEIYSLYEELSQKTDELAKSKTDEAIDYIIKRIFEL